MGRYLSFPFLLIAVVVQSTIMPEFRISGGGPDLIFMLVVSWTMLSGIQEGVIWAIVGGILQDLVAGLPLGLSSLSLVVVVSLTNLAVGQVARGNIIFPSLVAAVGTALYHVLLIVLLAVINRPVEVGYSLLYVTLPTLGFNAVLILIVFRVMGVVYASTRPRRVST